MTNTGQVQKVKVGSRYGTQASATFNTTNSSNLKNDSIQSSTKQLSQKARSGSKPSSSHRPASGKVPISIGSVNFKRSRAADEKFAMTNQSITINMVNGG